MAKCTYAHIQTSVQLRIPNPPNTVDMLEGNNMKQNPQGDWWWWGGVIKVNDTGVIGL